jgi:hypothetical protein
MWAVCGLAAGAKVRAALGDDDALDRLPTDKAGLAGAPEDPVLILEAAGRAAGAKIVLERAAAQAAAIQRDRQRQHLADPGIEAGDLGGIQTSTWPRRMDARLEERLVGIDVAHACHDGLVEQ